MAGPFEQFFSEYALGFNAFDAPRITSYFTFPCTMVNAEFVSTLSSEEAVLANMRGLLEYHRAEGYGGASVSDIRFATPP